MAIGRGVDWQISLERLDTGTKENPGMYEKSNCALVCLEFNGRNQITREKLNAVKQFKPFPYPDVVVPPKPKRSSPGTAGYGKHRNCKKQHYEDTKNEFHCFMTRRVSSSKYKLLTYEWIVRQFVKQKGRCYYSGMKLSWSVNSDWVISIERLDEDPKIGHMQANCVLVCHEFNTGGTQWSREKVEYLRTLPVLPPLSAGTVAATMLGKRKSVERE